MTRLSKKETEYTPEAHMKAQQCGKCTHFVKPSACEIVRGEIRAEGWCNKFNRK